ncbi:MAG: adenine phosphoribosyltransferase [Rikenellaceae bacterium]|nr:adenine phosphoribosyltransferase [Rikenellaceae bacterium]
MKNALKFYKDFPKEGIVFVDIIPLLQDKKIFAQLIEEIGNRLTAPNIAAPEARGFLFSAPLMLAKEEVQSIIPIRKSGKLPYNEGDLCDVEIEKEYGSDHLFYRLSDIAAAKADGDEIHISILDDLLATGGTAEGIAQSMMEQRIIKDGKEYKVVIDEFIFLVELDFLKGAERLEKIAPVKSIIHL